MGFFKFDFCVRAFKGFSQYGTPSAGPPFGRETNCKISDLFT